MKRANINFIIDLAVFATFISVVFTGGVIRFILPPGTGGIGRELSGGTGRENIEQFWYMTRHQWGDIHYILATIFTLLIIIHLLMHIGWIKWYIKCIFKSVKILK